jgi:hypothetical protein
MVTCVTIEWLEGWEGKGDVEGLVYKASSSGLSIVNRFPAFYETGGFMTVFTIAHEEQIPQRVVLTLCATE